ncbi:zinc finger protein 208-like [Neocloeon triangulifer]|uniref:zinc finger protein 208-like n=1 Tax=Neocloeon triangulifer TaxID=2078957 RepID=UPI00286F185B|nr:zinc finger protein 208-like [Neocloeon triangulifer]
MAHHPHLVNLKCSICSVLFTSMDAFKAHMPEHANAVVAKKAFKCNVNRCPMKRRVFLTQELLDAHKKLQHANGPSLIRCYLCPTSVSTHYVLRKHLMEMHGVDEPDFTAPPLPPPVVLFDLKGPLQCFLCPERFSSKQNLEIHISKHLDTELKSGTLFGCDSCDFSAQTYAILLKHYRVVHQQDRPIQRRCDFCLDEFRRAHDTAADKEHMMRHFKSYQFKCKICGKCNANKASLETHTLTFHQNEEGVFCDICKRNQTRARICQEEGIDSNLRMKRHLAQMNLKCRICSKTFIDVNKRKAHLQEHKKDSDRLFCENAVCVKNSLSFIDLDHLKLHMQIYHGSAKNQTQAGCRMCKEGSIDCKHRKQWPLKCGWCKKAFLGIENFKAHIPEHKKVKKASKIILKVTEQISCHLCKIPVVNLAEHFLMTHNATRLNVKCGLCSKQFESIDLFKRHMPEHMGKPSEETWKYKCNYIRCKQRFADKSFFITHVILIHKKKPLPCEFCDEVLIDKPQYLDHMKNFHKNKLPAPETLCDPEGQMFCQFCPERFLTRENLEKHILLHLESLREMGQPHCCKPCDFVTGSYRFLLRHLEDWHNIERKIVPKTDCDICGKVFEYRDSMQSHMRNHSVRRREREPKRPVLVTCDICGKILLKHSLLGHKKLLHENNISLVCEICGQIFTSENSLKIHMYRHSEMEFNCGHCDYKSHRKLYLEKHIERHMTKKVKCSICGASVLYLKNHLKKSHGPKQTFQCSICDKTISCNPKAIMTHRNSHLGLRPFKCEECGKSFAVQFNMRNHQLKKHGIKAFECNICNKPFQNGLNLKKHKEKVHFNLPKRSLKIS